MEGFFFERISFCLSPNPTLTQLNSSWEWKSNWLAQPPTNAKPHHPQKVLDFEKVFNAAWIRKMSLSILLIDMNVIDLLLGMELRLPVINYDHLSYSSLSDVQIFQWEIFLHVKGSFPTLLGNLKIYHYIVFLLFKNRLVLKKIGRLEGIPLPCLYSDSSLFI